MYRKSLFFTLILILPTLLFAENLPQVTFSRLTGTFGGHLPIGQDFEISGTIPDNIAAVRVESFGFSNGVPEKFKNQTVKKLKTTLNYYRRKDRDNVIMNNVGWERGNDQELSTFTVKHKRLYYSRTYVFVFTYLEAIDTTQQKARIRHLIRQTLKDRSLYTNSALNPDDQAYKDKIRKKFKAIAEPFYSLDNKGTIDLNSYVDNDIIGYIGNEVLLSIHWDVMSDFQEDLYESFSKTNDWLDDFNTPYSTSIEQMIKEINSEAISKNVDEVSRINNELTTFLFNNSNLTLTQINSENLQQLETIGDIFTTGFHDNDTNSMITGGPKLSQFIKDLHLSVSEAKRISKLETTVQGFISTSNIDSTQSNFPELYKALYEILQNRISNQESIERSLDEIGALVVRIKNSQNEKDIDVILNEFVAQLELDGYREVLASATVSPYLATVEEQHPFIMSLDGGMIYVADFNQLIPTVAVNVKINPRDFNDPKDKTPEFSLLAGMGMSKPDDLDPDYAGIFENWGDKSLVTGIGLRFPALSSIVRLQAGVLWYNKLDANPLIDDKHLHRSFFTGLSINWDALEFASNLLTNRSAISFN